MVVQMLLDKQAKEKESSIQVKFKEAYITNQDRIITMNWLNMNKVNGQM